MATSEYILLDEKIKKTYIDIIRRENRIPTQQEVADKCDISRETVNRHLNRIKLKEIVKPFKIFGNEVLMGLRNKAVKGDVQAAKLYFMLVYDWSEKQEHEVEHKFPKEIKIIKVTTQSRDEPEEGNETSG